ncbi:hypothetical protein BGZ76_003047, partial [Entomortierella beljakovae]
MSTSSRKSYTASEKSFNSGTKSTISELSSISSAHFDAINERNMEFIHWLATRLTSYDEEMHKEILEDFFTDDAKYIHPALTIEGRYNIRKVFRVWSTLNKDEPKVTKIVFDGKTAVISLIQNLRPRSFPMLHLEVPATTTLHFKETSIGPMVYCQQDSWSLEGIVQSMPLIGWWYDHVVRSIFGAVMSGAGGFIYTANQTTAYLQEVHKMSSDIIEKSSLEIQQRSKEMTTKAQLMVDQAKDSVEKKVSNAREEVDRMRSLFSNTKAITANESKEVV